MDEEIAALRGRRVLVVEDDYYIAVDLARALEAAGAVVVGPCGRVAEALALIESTGAGLDAATLDINLHDAVVYPVADALRARGVPFAFATGYDAMMVPPAYADVPRCEKPLDPAKLIRALAKNWA
jgi:CheY-like chemotaxis protein